MSVKMSIKKRVIIFLMSAFVFSNVWISNAADETLIKITGAVLNDQLNFKLDGISVVPVGDDGTPVLPVSYNGTTYLPVRAIGYLLGLGIDYDGPTKTVLIASTTTKVAPKAISVSKSNQLIPISNVVLNKALKFKLDSKSVVPVGDDGTPVLPISYNGTTFLPVRAIGYLLNLGIDYDGPTRTVLITRNTTTSSSQNRTQVWKLKEVKFTDATAYSETVLAGTTSYMYDQIGFTGSQNNLIISHYRYDKKTNKLLAGRKYQVIWTDPPEYLVVGEKISIEYETKSMESIVWKMLQNSININQGMGVSFAAPDGTKYIDKDMKALFTSEKVIEKGTKGQTRVIQVVHADGFKTEYFYEWIE